MVRRRGCSGARATSNALVELAPQDTARIEAAAAHVIGELDASPDTFFGRNQRALEKMGKRLAAWEKGGQNKAAVRQIRVAMSGVCAKLPAADPARAACDGALRPSPVKRAGHA